jgi:hypothetical protein
MKSKSHTMPAQAELLPIEAAPVPLEPEDLTSFALSENFSDSVAQKILSTVPVRKPAKESFIRTSPDPEHWAQFGLLELKELGKTYLVAPQIAASLSVEGESTMIAATLVLYVDRRGNPFLWPLKISDKENEWHVSARRAAELAKEKWLRLSANMGAGCYDILVASNQDTEPVWPKESYGEILKVAFRDRVVASQDHDILKELRGQF